MKPRISVIIPVYNSETFLSKCLGSVLRQSEPAHEIIVINDGSTDGTLQILESYGRKLIKLSGDAEWDKAVLRAVDKTETLPRDVDGRVPSLLVISFQPRE